MDNSTIPLLAQALDYGSARIQATSNNLTNLNTPGYKRKEVSFAALLDAARDQDDAPGLRTDPRHLALDAESEQTSPQIVTAGGGSMRADGNNVDVDAETTRLAATEIYYMGAAQLLQGQFSNLKYVISGGR